MDYEVELVRGLFEPIDAVVCFAPPTHLYGNLYGRVLPAQADVPVVDAWRDPLSMPTIGEGVTLVVCVPSTWALLLRNRNRWLPHTQRVIALHSTGPPPPAASTVLGGGCGVGNIRGIELLGSTETGAVAYREMAAPYKPDSLWTLLPDVRAHLEVGTQHELEVRGPRLAAGLRSRKMPDTVLPFSTKTFAHLGRSGDLVKVNGQRCSLRDVEHVVRGIDAVTDAAAIAVTDQVRGEHYELYFCADDSPGVEQEIAAALAAASCPRPLPHPRAVRRLAAIPRSETGKVLRDRLAITASVSRS